MRIRIWLIIASLLWGQAAVAERLSMVELADPVLENLGVYSAGAMFAEQFPAQLRTRISQSKDLTRIHERAQEVVAIITDGWDQSEVDVYLMNYALQNSTRAELEGILAWQTSPLGQKLIAADKRMMTDAGQAELSVFIDTLSLKKPSQERLDLVKSYEAKAQLTNTSMEMFGLMMVGAVRALNQVLPEEKRKSMDELNQEFKKIGPDLKQKLWQNMIASSLYVTRDLSDKEVQSMIDFVDSPAGKKSIELHKGVGDAFGKMMGKLIKQVESLRLKNEVERPE